MVTKNNHIHPLTPYASLVLYQNKKKTIVISDLHIGWEFPLTKKGIHIPSQLPKLLNKLKKIVITEKPDSLLFLGDIKQTFSKIVMEEWREIPLFFKEICQIVPEVKVIPGNHDGNIKALLPNQVKVLSSRGIVVGDVGLFHGHTWPKIEMLRCSTLIVGHMHPAVLFKDNMGFNITQPVWIHASCNGNILATKLLKHHKVKIEKNETAKTFLKKEFNIILKTHKFLIMPSFNDFLGGQPINRTKVTKRKKFKEFNGPVLRSGSINLDNSEIFLLDGTFLGTLSFITDNS
jgi:putative SbcD/Mre11-related phosphoesterase